ncbi:MAG: vitamin K epoxide reductase family protein, partial [Verrucomicrobiota bacterium]
MAESTSSVSPRARLGRLLLIIASGIAGYLAYVSISSGPVAGCGDGGGCHEVLASKWSSVFGLPVAIAGLFSYVALVLLDWKAGSPALRWILAFMIGGAAIWFTAVQFFIIESICPWCCTTHGLALLGVVILATSWKGAESLSGLSSGTLLKSLGGAIVALLGLVLAQAFGPEKKTTASTSVAGAVEGAPAGPGSSADGKRLVSLHEGKHQIDAMAFPAIGEAGTAKNLAVGLFDYTCRHCEELNEILTKIQGEFGNQFAVVKLPGAFNERGREIHRIMLGLWRQNRTLHDQIAADLHGKVVPSQPSALRQHVATKIGKAEADRVFAAERAWADKQILMTDAIRRTNKEVGGQTKFPQLLLNEHVEFGSNSNPGHYYSLLSEHFDIVRKNAPELVVSPEA